MGKHVFGYYGQLQEEELEKYWSKRDDIVYAHGSMAYYGRENVYNYYTGMTSAMKAQGRAVAEKFYGEKYRSLRRGLVCPAGAQQEQKQHWYGTNQPHSLSPLF